MKRKFWGKTAAITLTAVTATTGVGAMYYYVHNQNVMAKQDNGFYSFTGSDKGSFEKEKTPVSNMLILLKILNNSAQCDGEWYQEVERFIGMLEAQYNCNKESEDKFTNELMKVQCELIKDLKLMYSEMCEGNINKVQETYNKYRDTYYTFYNGGELNEGK